jgi:hypothetical protein
VKALVIEFDADTKAFLSREQGQEGEKVKAISSNDLKYECSEGFRLKEWLLSSPPRIAR